MHRAALDVARGRSFYSAVVTSYKSDIIYHAYILRYRGYIHLKVTTVVEDIVGPAWISKGIHA